jgi:hypothetical protein
MANKKRNTHPALHLGMWKGKSHCLKLLLKLKTQAPVPVFTRHAVRMWAGADFDAGEGAKAV